MIATLLWAPLIAFLWSGAGKPYSASTVGTAPISVRDVRADIPEFQRVYTVHINKDVVMKITIRNLRYFLGVLRDGELDQTGGRWVMFEPERPADKILDREILPLVEKYCQQIIQIDNKWRESKPNEFTDERGVVWRRVN